MNQKLPISLESFIAGIDRLIDRAAAIAAKYPRKPRKKSTARPLARTA